MMFWAYLHVCSQRLQPHICLKPLMSLYCKKVAVHSMPATQISSVVGIFLIVIRLIWHGLNNYLPASDWHSHKKGWVGLGSRWWHSTWPNWSISMLGRRCSTGGQHHTIYFAFYGAQTHGHQSWHPEGRMLLCPAVPRLMTSEFPIRSSAGRQEPREKTHCNKSVIPGYVSDVKARDSHVSPWH